MKAAVGKFVGKVTACEEWLEHKDIFDPPWICATDQPE